MARNRKRAKERRARRPQPVVGRIEREEAEERPEPIRHAAPDVEIAEAQLALGRPDLVEGEAEAEPEAGDNELEYELAEPSARDDDGAEDTASVAVATATTAAPAHRRGLGGRLIGFLRGSWAELQRVQWPDRRQVAQATGVVIGFVIVAGLFLGLADVVSQKLMNFILK